MLISVLISAVTSGAFGYWLGRRRRKQDEVPEGQGDPNRQRLQPHDEQALWMLQSKAESDSDDVVRMRFVHINDVYIMDNLPKLRKFLDDCSMGLRRENLVVSIGGDLLSPYPLSTLDKGRGMVDVMLESGVQYACFGNHEADVGLPALKKRVERWHERGGVWINTNMPELWKELRLPSYASVVGLSKDGHHSRQVCLLGVCTIDPGLYNAPDDFGGAIYSAKPCNEAALEKSQSLMEAHLEDDEAQKVDAVVALTHQDLDIDIELAKKACAVGIYAVLGGHDHTEYAAKHNGCALLKAGMDAKNAAVMDFLWSTTEDTAPSLDSFQLIPLSKFTGSKAVFRSVQKHMQKLWKMEQRKALVHLTVFPEKTLMSSKDIRKKQTTLGSFLCSALRDELEVDCVLFDGGNIRGDKDYEPNPEHYLGSRWTFTLADLEQELPWSSEMVIIVLRGQELREALHYSRTVKLGSGGFLQADGGVHVDPATQEVKRVGNEPLDYSRIYRVGVMHASLAGMNGNPVFEEWRKRHIMPQEDSGKPAKELLKKQFSRRMWDKMPEFHEINVSQSGVLSREEVRNAYVQTFTRCCESVDASMDQLLAVADADETGEITSFNYEAIFRLPTWITLAHFTKEQAISSKKSSSEQTLMGSFLCDALRKELEVDCVLFDGGNVRGDRDYCPQPGHHRGSKWAFTVADLRRELPWPSEMATVRMEGRQISEAVQASRAKVSTPSRRLGSKAPAVPNIAGISRSFDSSHQLAGGFLQCDSGMQVRPDNSVSRIAGEPIDFKKRYTVGVLYNALMGMNQNPVFEKWRNEPGNRIVGQRPHARELLTRHFLRRLWKLTQNKLNIKQDEDISRDKLHAAIQQVFPRAGGNMRRSLLRRLLSTVVVEDGSGRGFKSSGITYKEYQNTLSKVSHEEVEGHDYERECNDPEMHERYNTGGSRQEEVP